MADYSATVIEGLKKFGFSEATVLFFKNQIGDGYYYRPQWRYSIASEKITIEFDVPTIRYYIYYQGILNFSDCGVHPIGFAMVIL